MHHPNASLWESFLQLLNSYTVDDFSSAESENKIMAEMENAGFKKDEAKTVFYWMKNLKQWMNEYKNGGRTISHPANKSIRIYTPEENASFSPEAKTCLKNLEEAQVIDVDLREQIIDQAMNLLDGTIDVPALKWIVFPLLFNGQYRIPSEKQLLAVLMLSGDKTVKH